MKNIVSTILKQYQSIGIGEFLCIGIGANFILGAALAQIMRHNM